MTDVLEIPSFVRDATASGVAIDGNKLVLSASSSEPVERIFGTEILDHSPNSVDMRRLNASAIPLLFNHDWDDPIGMVTTGRLDDGRLMVESSLFDTNRTQEVRAMIDGGLRNVSVGYQIHEMKETGPNEFTATRWEPHEISIVTVPADISVGVGRSVDDLNPVRIVRTISKTAVDAESEEVRTMTDEKTGTAPDAAENSTHVEITREVVKHDPVGAEKQRVQGIEKIGKANNIDTNTIRSWIDEGAQMEKVADDLLDILEERSKSANAPALIGMSKKEVKEYSVIRALQAAASNNWHKAGLELEAHRFLKDRDNLQQRESNSVFLPMDVQARQSTYATRDFNVSGAGNLVGTDHLGGSFIDLLRNMSVTMSSGATRLTGLRGNVAIPKMTAGTSAYWLASETTAITESQPTIGQVTLSPKNVAALTEISHQMLQQGDPSAEALVLNDLAASVALAADIGALRGDGTGGAPTGIENTAGIGAFTGTSLDYAAVLNAQEDVVSANADRLGNLAYVCDPATTTKLMTRVKFASTASPIWDGNIREGNCAGLPGRTSNQMAADSMLFGAWSSLIIAEWGTLELAVNPTQNFAAGTVGVRAWYTMDAAVRYPGAFSLATSIT